MDQMVIHTQEASSVHPEHIIFKDTQNVPEALSTEYTEMVGDTSSHHSSETQSDYRKALDEFGPESELRFELANKMHKLDQKLLSSGTGIIKKQFDKVLESLESQKNDDSPIGQYAKELTEAKKFKKKEGYDPENWRNQATRLFKLAYTQPESFTLEQSAVTRMAVRNFSYNHHTYGDEVRGTPLRRDTAIATHRDAFKPEGLFMWDGYPQKMIPNPQTALTHLKAIEKLIDVMPDNPGLLSLV